MEEVAEKKDEARAHNARNRWNWIMFQYKWLFRAIELDSDMIFFSSLQSVCDASRLATVPVDTQHTTYYIHTLEFAETREHIQRRFIVSKRVAVAVLHA